MITDEDKERVRQATDIVTLVGETVELRQRGREFWGCCPFHGEKTPSFKVNFDTGLWHCFGCGEGGDVFSYVMKRDNLEFPDAIRALAERAGIELAEEQGAGRGPKRNRLLDCLAEAESFYSTMLMRGRGPDAQAARSYFAGRGFGADVCRRWNLGYAPGRGALVADLREKGFSPAEMYACDLAMDRNGRPADRFFERVMFPIHDERGRTIAFGGRVLTKGKPVNTGKYVNTRDTVTFNKRKHLFAYDRAKETMVATGTAVICEGYTDVISMHEHGYTNAVAALGTAFTADHIKLLERQRVSRIICMFDGDAAGQRAAERAIQFIDKTSAALVCVVLPDNQDPMEFLSTHAASELQGYLDRAQPLMDFVFEKRLSGADLSAPGKRVKALDEMAQVLAPLKHSVILDGYATRLADALGMDAEQTKRIIREKPIAEQPKEGPRSQGQQTARPRGRAREDEPPAYDEPAYYDEAPDDYVPYDGPVVESAPQELVALSADERMQLSSERELLSLLAASPDSVRPYAERIATFSWTDARHESMAWAMLATPEGSTPASVVAAATAVEPDATRILSSGRVTSEEELNTDAKARLLVDTVELYSSRRRIREIKAKLRSTADSVPDAETESLFKEATALQKRANELVKCLSAVQTQ